MQCWIIELYGKGSGVEKMNDEINIHCISVFHTLKISICLLEIPRSNTCTCIVSLVHTRATEIEETANYSIRLARKIVDLLVFLNLIIATKHKSYWFLGSVEGQIWQCLKQWSAFRYCHYVVSMWTGKNSRQECRQK